MTEYYTQEDMESVLSELHIVPERLPLLSARGLAWRKSLSDDQWKAWLREGGYAQNRNALLAAMKKAGLIAWKDGLIDGNEVAAIYNWRVRQMYPDEELPPYTRESVVFQVELNAITPYRVMNPATGKPQTHKHYYEYKDAFYKKLKPRHVHGSVEGWKRRMKLLEEERLRAQEESEGDS